MRLERRLYSEMDKDSKLSVKGSRKRRALSLQAMIRLSVKIMVELSSSSRFTNALAHFVHWSLKDRLPFGYLFEMTLMEEN